MSLQQISAQLPHTAAAPRDSHSSPLPNSPSRDQTRSDPVVPTQTIAAVLAVLLITFIAAFVTPSAAQASANKCSGGKNPSCVDVKGKHRHVDRIRSQVIPAGNSCITGHSQIMINGRHYADSYFGRDGVYCGKGWPGKKITTWTWYVNRDYAKGTRICSKFWQRVDGRYRQSGNACATVG